MSANLAAAVAAGPRRREWPCAAALEVDAAGDALAGSFTLEFVAAGGASRGEEGPLRVEGRRVRAEPPSAQATPPAAAP